MKKLSWLMITLLTTVVVLTACGKDNTDTSSEVANNEESNQVTTTNDNQSSEKSNNRDTPDQLDLSIGDTGNFDTTLGTFDLTLHSAKLVGTELDGITTDLDEIILIDLTLKNTSKSDLKIEDALVTLEISDNIDFQGESDRADLFESVEEFIGVLKPGEEKKGQFVAETYTADEYYFHESVGGVVAGVTNQVRWTFSADEAK